MIQFLDRLLVAGKIDPGLLGISQAHQHLPGIEKGGRIHRIQLDRLLEVGQSRGIVPLGRGQQPHVVQCLLILRLLVQHPGELFPGLWPSIQAIKRLGQTQPKLPRVRTALYGPLEGRVGLLIIPQLELTHCYVEKILRPGIVSVERLKNFAGNQMVSQVDLLPCLFIEFVMTFLLGGPVSGQTLRSKYERKDQLCKLWASQIHSPG